MREKYGIVHHDGPVMELTTMIGCPVMCTFCPQDNLRTNYGDDTKYMQPMDLLAVLVKLPKNTRIDFSGMSEPWANPACTTMLEMVLYMGFKVAIYTTLYGMTDPESVRTVLEQHPDQVEVIMLHLPDANGNMKGWKNSDEWQDTVIGSGVVQKNIRNCQLLTMSYSHIIQKNSEVRHKLDNAIFDGAAKCIQEYNNKPYHILCSVPFLFQRLLMELPILWMLLLKVF
jgi:organic radical activating enzyme